MTDWEPLMSEDAHWYAVQGHIPPARMLRQLIDEGMIDGLLATADIDYGRPCGHGDDDCECSGWVVPWKFVLLRWARDIRHVWVRPPREWYGKPGWWFQCSADRPDAEPATVWSW